MTSIPTIRPATPDDAAPLAGLVAGLMADEGKTNAGPTAGQLAQWLSGETPMIEVLLAERDGAALGYLAFYRAFSLFRPGPVMLVENVYVVPETRGSGIGKRLLVAAAQTALNRGWGRLELNVADGNPGADAAYRALGLSAPGESVRRVEDAGLATLAARR
ncbi:GNAT family N-acetyltransferase [Rhodovibrio salinarum]|uniref:GNAT family N-acetyltransferase n=1 Tax=Rhodovibrio salinarum TaxID=1087 RepID=A0A934QHX4_9PROT|nr:GNAT family N-acetyltransferase [Rhodovibrio salinarum]MBK1697351.1 GNAT family N-acetyltransferase [Rhodovibrio salinarum]